MKMMQPLSSKTAWQYGCMSWTLRGQQSALGLSEAWL
jgi:hypothetical protein